MLGISIDYRRISGAGTWGWRPRQATLASSLFSPPERTRRHAHPLFEHAVECRLRGVSHHLADGGNAEPGLFQQPGRLQESYRGQETAWRLPGHLLEQAHEGRARHVTVRSERLQRPRLPRTFQYGPHGRMQPGLSQQTQHIRGQGRFASQSRINNENRVEARCWTTMLAPGSCSRASLFSISMSW